MRGPFIAKSVQLTGERNRPSGMRRSVAGYKTTASSRERPDSCSDGIAMASTITKIEVRKYVMYLLYGIAELEGLRSSEYLLGGSLCALKRKMAQWVGEKARSKGIRRPLKERTKILSGDLSDGTQIGFKTSGSTAIGHDFTEAGLCSWYLCSMGYTSRPVC